jgi:hypothetical protein
MSEQEPITLTEVFSVTPGEIYDSWLDAERHGAMTGSTASFESQPLSEGSAFTAWDGYIRGRMLELDNGRRMLMSWRSEDYPEEAADSTVEVQLESVDGGTRLTLTHSVIPAGQRDDYIAGWKDFYFEPMHRYFTTHVDEPTGPEVSLEEVGAEGATGAPTDTLYVEDVEVQPPAVVEVTETTVTTLRPVVDDEAWGEEPTEPAKPVTHVAAKAPAKKAAPKKKAAAPKAAPKKAAAKKAAPKKAAQTKKKPAKKAAAKKAVAKKPAKKAAAKKAAPKKPAKKAGKAKPAKKKGARR